MRMTQIIPYNQYKEAGIPILAFYRSCVSRKEEIILDLEEIIPTFFTQKYAYIKTS